MRDDVGEVEGSAAEVVDVEMAPEASSVNVVVVRRPVAASRAASVESDSGRDVYVESRGVVSVRSVSVVRVVPVVDVEPKDVASPGVALLGVASEGVAAPAVASFAFCLTPPNR